MKYLAIVCLLFLSACNTDDDSVDCSTVLCATPELILQFVDAQTEDDVFVDGPYDIQDLQIIDQANQMPVPFRVTEFEGELFIFFDTFVSVTTARSYQFSVEGNFSINLSFTAVPDLSDDCCPRVDYENVNADEAEVEQLSGFNTFRVSI